MNAKKLLSCVAIVILAIFAAEFIRLLWYVNTHDRPRDVYEAENQAREILRLIHVYRAEHGEWPPSLEDVPIPPDYMTNALTGDNPGFEYVVPNESYHDFDPSTVILYQLRDGQRDMSLDVGFADGTMNSEWKGY